MHPQAYTRELTLKERTTEDLRNSLDDLYSQTFGGTQASTNERAEIDAIEAELEERSEYERKVSRW